MHDTETANDHHNPRDNKPVPGDVNVSGTIQVIGTPSWNAEHKAEREEDKEYKDATRSHENRSITVAKVTALISALYFIATVCIFLESKRSADAAKKAADISGNQLEMSQRPWVQVGLQVGGPLVIDKNGLNLIIQAVSKTSGNSPAKSVLMESKLYVSSGFSARRINEMRDAFCEDLKKRAAVNQKYLKSLFPRDPSTS